MAAEPPEILKLLARMAKIVGHEVRNPLAVMKNSTHFVKTKLSTGAELDPKIAKHLGFIEAEIERANLMIDDIVLLGRAQTVEPAIADLHGLVDDAINAFPPAQAGNVARDFMGQKLAVSGDAEKLRIAFHKLISNAIEASPIGGKVAVATYAVPGHATVKIADSGPGFNKEALDHLYEPFFTTKPRGLGLGLTLARMIVERHGGTIKVESPAGKGATVAVTLPLRAE